MGLFDKKDHIKSPKELHEALKKEKYLSAEERKKIEMKAGKFVQESSGISKEEWKKKVVLPMERDTKDKIDRVEANRLKKFGK